MANDLVLRASDYWWAFVIRGAAAVIFGILAFVWPEITLAVLVLLWGAFALVDGIFSIVGAVRGGSNPRWLLLVQGIAGVAAGVLTFIWPGLTALVLLYIIAAWALITGVLEVVAAVRLRRAIENEWLMALSGVLSVVFGLLLILDPAAGALAVVWLIGAYAVLFGVLMLVLGVRLRGLRDEPRRAAQAA
jgi:uncharacterized membrane protein HdeD (DUF308 family)